MGLDCKLESQTKPFAAFDPDVVKKRFAIGFETVRWIVHGQGADAIKTHTSQPAKLALQPRATDLPSARHVAAAATHGGANDELSAQRCNQNKYRHYSCVDNPGK